MNFKIQMNFNTDIVNIYQNIYKMSITLMFVGDVNQAIYSSFRRCIKARKNWKFFYEINF